MSDALRKKLKNTRMEHVKRKADRRKKEESVMELELIGGVFVVEKFSDGTERREEIDGAAVLKLVEIAIKRGAELMEMAEAEDPGDPGYPSDLPA